MFQSPKVSVCMITYGHEKFIEEAINGVLMQECNFEIEIIISNDFSFDNTNKIVNSFIETHPRGHLIKYTMQSKNMGMMPNFIWALEKCKGKYTALCEGDDYWTDPLKLQKQIDFLDKHEDYILSFHDVDIQNTRKNNNRTYRMIGSLDKNSLETNDLLKPWFMPTCSVVFRKLENFSLPKWFALTPNGDKALLLLLSLEGKFKYLNEIMGVYRKHDNGISVSYTSYTHVFSMIHLYQNFNEYTNNKFKTKLHQAMKSEIHTHLPEFHELRSLRRSKKVKVIKIMQAIASKIRGILG